MGSVWRIEGILAVPVMLAICIAAAAAPAKPLRQVARDFRDRQQAIQYEGPGRELSDPAHIDEILLGYFGPTAENDGSAAGDLWSAAQLAIDEANAEGGYRGQRFRLVSAWSESPWDAGVKQLASLVYRDRIWAIIGGIDGPSTHLAEQVAAKARLAVISPVSTDKSANLAGVPWIFSCSAGDHLAAPKLCNAIVQQTDNRPIVILESNGHDPHRFTVELRKELSARHVAPEYHLQFRATDLGPNGTPIDRLIAQVLQAEPGAVVIVADATTSGSLVRQLIETGYPGPIFGSPTMARRAFRRAAGRAADGVVFPLVSTAGTDDTSKAWHPFAARFQNRYGRMPDGATGKTFDAVRLTIEAIRTAGLNRAKISDAIRNLAPWQGVAGTIAWDRVGANTGPVRLGTVRRGQLSAWRPAR